jgi:hypothetical protein
MPRSPVQILSRHRCEFWVSRAPAVHKPNGYPTTGTDAGIW